jgi:hypothetical protein
MYFAVNFARNGFIQKIESSCGSWIIDDDDSCAEETQQEVPGEEDDDDSCAKDSHGRTAGDQGCQIFLGTKPRKNVPNEYE